MSEAAASAADASTALETARELVADAEIVDLHIDTLIPPRLWGYDPLERHTKGVLGGRLFGHLDLPRLEEAGVSGAMWSITTNPFRTAASRWRRFQDNLQRLQELVRRSEGRMAIARTHSEYVAARRTGAHVVLPAIQGGNALEAAPEGVASIPDDLITRITLVHLTSSTFGETSSPLKMRRGGGLTEAGRAFVDAMDERRIFVDLAHLNAPTFWDAVEAHDSSLPLIATHTGVAGVRPHWRNLDDDQIRAIAESGGTVGIIASTQFLARKGGPRDADMVLEHLEHVLDVGGEGAASLGTDFDGAIVPPPDLRDGATAYVRLVERMIARGWTEQRIRAVLAGNALRALEALRP